jgi:hypothetical protein
MLPPEVHARLANLFLEAADEIASHQLFGDPEQLHTLRRQRDLALKERDEARQRLCKVVGDARDMWGEDVAKEYGWDCFKETP